MDICQATASTAFLPAGPRQSMPGVCAEHHGSSPRSLLPGTTNGASTAGQGSRCYRFEAEAAAWSRVAEALATDELRKLRRRHLRWLPFVHSACRALDWPD